MSSSTTRYFWNSLPPEIRLLILRCIALNFESKETVRASSLATVSREWRSFFEGETFRRIALASPDLPAFSKVVRGEDAIRPGYIRNLYLRIRLAEYTKRIYDKPESATNIKENNRTFTSDMTVLLNSLSSWEGTRGGLTLEINAHSPSDQIFHRSEGEVHDDYPIRFKEDLKDLRSFLEYLRDKRAARVTSIAVPRSVRRGAARRLRGTPLELLPQRQKRGTCSTNNLPRVPIVKGLVLRRSFFRGIAPESIATLLRESFVALESFYLHKWIGQTPDLQTCLMPTLPPTVRRFSFDQSSRWDSCKYASAPKKLEGLARLMATSCHRFTEFSPPLKNKESKLQHLTLRTQHLRPRGRQNFVTDFLIIAALAAMKLPRIRILEIWNSGHRFGYLFRYAQDSHRATITWRVIGSQFVLMPKVVGAWTRVASRRPLAIEWISFTDANGTSFNHISIHRHLALRRLAFDPITEAQIAAGMAL
ncbi:hypothetical protein B0J15DRAFT_534266 [Fusarium solani]|uniref:DUF6546 domain-containing protein n=1 Tax=Fusarium solani TaxID=169388 RepID=A0A9P9HYC9_FUSSL|nr:uncharacterized protein B0J15DRAFT_534266 [Fusarium solani]KAH7266178.1 hypothetical protein B0J15DRAFT_534266 [Fusarium solani]